jgi:protoporphyrinogen IX oxidase
MQFLVALHVFANTVWIGAIASVGWLLHSASRAADDARGSANATAAYQLYRTVATPAFVVSFLAGGARLASDAGAYMSLHWFHGKLTAAIAVIALHHVLGARARRAASGSRQAGRSSAILPLATLACAFVAVTFAVLKGQLVP